MGFFTAKFTLKDAFYISLINCIFLWFSVIAAITNYGTVTAELALARTQQAQLKTCLDYAGNVDGWWISKWLIAAILTPIAARIYYTKIKPIT